MHYRETVYCTAKTIEANTAATTITTTTTTTTLSNVCSTPRQLDCSLNTSQTLPSPSQLMELCALLNNSNSSRIDALLNPETPPSPLSPKLKRRRLLDSPTCITENFLVDPVRIELSTSVHQQKDEIEEKIQQCVQRRLAKSRIVGLRHRIAERMRCEKLIDEVNQLQNVNNELILKNHVCDMLVIDGDADGYKVDDCTAEIIGATHVSGQCALALLEIIGLRRNLDRSTMVLMCPMNSEVDKAIEIVKERSRLFKLGYLHANWTKFETEIMMDQCGNDEDEDDDDNDYDYGAGWGKRFGSREKFVFL